MGSYLYLKLYCIIADWVSEFVALMSVNGWQNPFGANTELINMAYGYRPRRYGYKSKRYGYRRWRRY